MAYNVIYNNNSGVGSIASQEVEELAAVILSDGVGFSKVGYTLSKWNTADDGTGTDYTLSQEIASYELEDDLTLYAVWAVNEYTITFEYGDADGGDTTASKNVDYGSVAGVLPVPSLTDYIFMGWYSAAEGGTLWTAETVYFFADDISL